MTRRRLLLFAAVACLLLAGLFVVHWAKTPAPGVTRENFERLCVGMKSHEVQAVMGRPPDMSFYLVGRGVFYWNDGAAEVCLYMTDHAVAGHFSSKPGFPVDVPNLADASFSAKIRRWLGL